MKKKRLTFRFWPSRREVHLFEEERKEREKENWTKMQINKDKRAMVAAVRAVEKCREVEVYEHEIDLDWWKWYLFTQ